MHFTRSTLTALAALLSINGVTASPIASEPAAEPATVPKPELRLPKDLAEGYYSGDGTVNPETGFANYKFEGPIDWKAVAGSTAARQQLLAGDATTTASTPLLAKRWGPVCSGHGAGDYTDNAIGAFPSQWDGVWISSGSWVGTYVGNSIAYACNYHGSSQQIQAWRHWSDHGNMNAQCGSGAAAWFDHRGDGYDLNYGRDRTEVRICF